LLAGKEGIAGEPPGGTPPTANLPRLETLGFAVAIAGEEGKKRMKKNVKKLLTFKRVHPLQ